MVPRDSNEGWSYEGDGCVSPTRGDEWFTMHLDLPDQSRIDDLRLFYYDESDTEAAITEVVD